MQMRRYLAAFLLVLSTSSTSTGQTLDVPAGSIPGDKPGTMMSQYWLRQTDQAFQRWQRDYDQRKTPEQVAVYQKGLREKFLAAIGGLPERTPLNPRITGTIQRDGYRVEKIVFESQPRHFVTALLFLPQQARFRPPFPGVLVPCGHALNAKGYDAYQSMGALLALNGMAALVVDPVDQGERGQYLGAGGWPKLWGTQAHFHLGIGSTLLGRNTARFEIWDNMRAIDYLESRPELDRQRIGVTGNSGGGTQTSYIMALDDRIKAAAPSCYLCGFAALLKTIGPQDAEQNIFGQIAFGMDHADYLMMRAPTPILICAATKDFFDIRGTWDIFRSAKRLYGRMDFAERIGILENDAPHNYNTLQREAVVRWMSRWLLHRDQPIAEPPLRLLTDKEVQCTPDGQVMLLPGARSAYDLNEDYERQLAPRRAESWKTGNRTEMLAAVRQLAGIRKLEALPKPRIDQLGTIQRSGYHIEQRLLRPEEGIVLPALVFLPEKPKPGRIVLYVHEDGKAADASPRGPIEQLVQDGAVVLAVDLRGTGQTRPAGGSWKDAFMGYLLGRSYVGIEAEDVLTCARYAKESSNGDVGVELIAVGHVGISALHAACVESNLFQRVKLVRTLESWSGVVRGRLTQVQQGHTVHGALLTYDLPDLAATLGPKLTIEQPTDGKTLPSPANKKPAGNRSR